MDRIESIDSIRLDSAFELVIVTYTNKPGDLVRCFGSWPWLDSINQSIESTRFNGTHRPYRGGRRTAARPIAGPRLSMILRSRSKLARKFKINDGIIRPPLSRYAHQQRAGSLQQLVLDRAVEHASTCCHAWTVDRSNRLIELSASFRDPQLRPPRLHPNNQP